MAHRACALQNTLGTKKCVEIDGRATEWLEKAIAAWCLGRVVVFFDGKTKRSVPQLADNNQSTHAIFFTSGTTGEPKPVIRTTEFALFEAAAYQKTLGLTEKWIAVSQVFPWFGAMTKHTLGMLLQGIPQYFHIPDLLPAHTKSLLYCTPSQLLSAEALQALSWDAMSFTGEPLNAAHVAVMERCLAPSGYVLDAFGETACGVIATRQVKASNLHQLTETFCGRILPGKAVFSNEKQTLTVRLPNNTSIALDDLGRVSDGKLTLHGRASNQRKIRGVWTDVTPLLNVCRTRKDIYHVELDKSTNGIALHVRAAPTLTADALSEWLALMLPHLRLLPEVIMDTSHLTLGRTGKTQVARQVVSEKHAHLPHIKVLVDVILMAKNKAGIREKFQDISFEAQGLTSLDLVTLASALESHTGYTQLRGNLLKTDTPRKVTALLETIARRPCILKEVFNDSASKQLLCLGEPLSVIHEAFRGEVHLLHCDAIEGQRAPFAMRNLAKAVHEAGEVFFQQNKKRYIAAYSIHALLAIAVSEVFEKEGIPVEGVFLLDPPHVKRRRTLRCKYPYLKLRQTCYRMLMKLNIYKNKIRYGHELRKLAIAKHPKIFLNTPVFFVHTDPKRAPEWVLGVLPKTALLKNVHHLALIQTKAGIQTWLPYLKQQLEL